MSNDADWDFVHAELQRLRGSIEAWSESSETGFTQIRARLDAVEARVDGLETRVTDLERRMRVSPELMRELEKGSK